MSPIEQNRKSSPKEKTIRSETNKIFMIIFGILFAVGIFTIGASIRGARTFSELRADHLDRYRAVETVKQNALDIIAIYYVLATNQDQNILMAHLMRYDGLIKGFNDSIGKLRSRIQVEKVASSRQISARLDETGQIFDRLNQSCREMTFALMEGKPDKAAPQFEKIDADVKLFKKALDEIEATIQGELDGEIVRSEALLEKVTWLGVLLTIGSLAISLWLIYGLSRFLSISLLPISNMMNNMKQSVFAIGRDMSVISPASRYSSVVFGKDVVGRNLIELFYEGSNASLESKDLVRSALETAFDGDDLQWILSKEHLPRQVTKGGHPQQHLQVSFTPLWDKAQKLESILTVVEDVTELESLRRKSMEKDRELQIIQELAGAGRRNVQEFLDDSFHLVNQCLSQKGGITATQLLRLLHTLKGNAGMFRLSSISGEMHALESEIELSQERQIGLSQGAELTRRVEAVFQEFSEIAARFMEIETEWVAAKSGTHAESGKDLVVSAERYRKALSTLKALEEAAAASEVSRIREATAQVSRLGEHTLKDHEFKLRAIVTKWAGSFEKEIDLEIVGDEIFLSKERMKSLLDALGHLVRNSIDHGIESADARRAAGKPVEGKIRISGSERPGETCLWVSDDGRGADFARLRSMALEKGLVPAEEIGAMNSQALLELMFLPGFSTKGEVNEISGRGVGLNAVRDIISRLEGTIQAEQPDEGGLRFEIRLPAGGMSTPQK